MLFILGSMMVQEDPLSHGIVPHGIFMNKSGTSNEQVMNKLSRITNKWTRFGVPLVGCGDCSEVPHRKLQGTVSTYMQSLV